MKTKSNLIYAEESFLIMGIIFKVYNNLGYGHKESVFQKAIANELTCRNIDFVEQLRCKIKYRGNDVGLYILDFLVFGKIVLEIKQKNFISGKDIKQLYMYLKATNLKLGIIITFTPEQVRYKRIVNLNSNHS